MMSRDHFGIYRGIVASDIHQDEEGRMRVRVRVPYVHTPSVETEALPFAEMCQDVGQMRGKFFPFRSGDLVWVMFDGGEPDKPVIVGGQVNAIKGVSDLPLDVQIEQSGEVVVETDDAGNTIIRDGRLDRRKLTFRSGGAEVEITGIGDEVRINAVSGAVVVTAAQASVSAAAVSVEAQRVDVVTSSTDAYGRDVGSIHESANDRIVRNVQASVPGTGNADIVHGVINDGGVVPTLRGVPAPPGRPLQASKHNLRSRVINIGVGPTRFVMDPDNSDLLHAQFVDYEPNLVEAAKAAANGTPSNPVPLLPTVEVNIRSSESVNIMAPAVTVGAAERVSVQSQGDLKVVALGDASVDVAGSVEATVGGNVSATVGGDVDLTAGGSAEVIVGSDADVIIGGSADLTVGASMTAVIGGSLAASVGGTADLNIAGAVAVSAGANIDIVSASLLTLAAPLVVLSGPVRVDGPLRMNGPLTGMTGISLDLHRHPYTDDGAPSVTLPPVA